MADTTSSAWTWVRRYLLAPLPAILLIAGAILLVILGAKNVQIGGLLGKLFGKKGSKKAVDSANAIPEDRVDDEGRVIPPGAPDAKGITQAVVVSIEPPGLFSDPDTVKFTPPGETRPVEVQLPEGIKASDVDKVLVVTPEIVAVTVKDNSKVSAKTVDDLLEKYGTKS